jgi:acetylornithine/LysW-gamma-L-lysine aminotransferase
MDDPRISKDEPRPSKGHQKVFDTYSWIRDAENAHGTGVTPKRDLAIVSGEGALLRDATGRSYVDMGASYGVCNAGHSHPAVADAIAQQARTLMYVTPTVHNDARASLMARLARLAPGDLDRVFLTSSGTESVEAAIKFARKHTGRPRIVAAKRAFHGRTMGALSLTWNPKYRKGFEPLLPGVDFVTYGDAEALTAAVTPETAAVILEPVQGEGGVHPAPPGYLKATREICDDAGALMVVDEVQTGLGRTGRMFAVEHWDVVPDIMTLAKSLANGMPLGAMLARPHVCDLPPGSHGGTFAGSPISCAAALATLDVIERRALPARADRLGDRALTTLKQMEGQVPSVRAVRGMGLMLGIELRQRAAPFLAAAMANGVLALPAGASVIRLLPPLVISEPVLDEALATLKGVLADG